jgi:hypothetical protein
VKHAACRGFKGLDSHVCDPLGVLLMLA